MRLNQFLARAGFGSRRACEELILGGAVTINGHRLRELATRVEAGDNVLVHGKPVKLPLPIVAILHKPAGFLCTSPESTKERTIYDLLPTGWPRVVYVGRLDKDSEGLLVVTNDGLLAQRLTHPSSKIPKTYIVTLDREFDFALAPKMKKGVAIEEGFARMDEIYRVGPRGLKVVLTQGLKRQIREMFYKFGYEVRRLVRVQIGALQIGDLQPGQHRVLTQADVKRYFPEKTRRVAPRHPERSEGSVPLSGRMATELIPRQARDDRNATPRPSRKPQAGRSNGTGAAHG
jgi:23S rRNA pseudouridine2605 synthase